MSTKTRRPLGKPAHLRLRTIAVGAPPPSGHELLPPGEQLPEIRIARSDYLELGDLLAKQQKSNLSPAMRFLERELSRAAIVDDRSMPSYVATLRSHVAFHDAQTGRAWAVTLGHPADFLRREDAISVLSPLGAALIGLAEGGSIDFATADEKSRRVTLVRVLHQPGRFGRGAAAEAGAEKERRSH